MNFPLHSDKNVHIQLPCSEFIKILDNFQLARPKTLGLTLKRNLQPILHMQVLRFKFSKSKRNKQRIQKAQTAKQTCLQAVTIFSRDSPVHVPPPALWFCSCKLDISAYTDTAQGHTCGRAGTVGPSARSEGARAQAASYAPVPPHARPVNTNTVSQTTGWAWPTRQII